MPIGCPILVKGAAGRVGGVGGAVVEALRRRDLPVRALVRRDDERVDASRATGAEVVVAPRPALTGTRLDPCWRTAEDRSLAWERAGQRQ